MQTLTEGVVGGIAAAIQSDAPSQPQQASVQAVERERWIRPRPIRELLAQLDDDASEAFEEYLDTLDGESFDRVCETAGSIANLDGRVAWAQQFLATENHDSDASIPSTSRSASDGGLPDVPPALYPVLAQLTPEEQTLGAQLLLVLDRATVDAFTAQLAAMSPENALKVIREAIAEAQRRSPSVAVGSSRVDLQACKLEYSIVSPK